jgi:hypothetical protein
VVPVPLAAPTVDGELVGSEAGVVVPVPLAAPTVDGELVGSDAGVVVPVALAESALRTGPAALGADALVCCVAVPV